MGIESPLLEGEKQWLRQFGRRLDQLDGRVSHTTSFLDPRLLELAEAALKNNHAYSYTIGGGYPEAERNVIHLFPVSRPGVAPPVKAVLVQGIKGEPELGHRDILGAVLGLGLRRDQIGDIVHLENDVAAIMVLETKADYIATKLVRVGRQDVTCRVVDPEELSIAEENGKEIKGTVASLRTDAVLSLGFGLSRSRMTMLIKGGLVRVNWRPVSSPSLQLKEGDQLSLKGRGRLLLEKVEGETRRGRLHLRLKRYS
ncbi:MAG: YlmH/Sll1252 family protein [Bacillota bacterium]|nr:YlmH/Sll1252 family protein [Bacillota bacterium]